MEGGRYLMVMSFSDYSQLIFFLYLLLLYYFASDSIVGMKTGIQQNVMKSTDRNYILLIIPELLVGMPLTF